jgi:hypothetical protein
MPEPVAGVLLTPDECSYALAAFGVLLRDRHPSARLRAFIDKLAKSVADAGVSGRNADVDASRVVSQDGSGEPARYDLVDTREAATVLGCTPNGVRDLCRRGSLPSFRAGGRWLLPAASVIQRAERKAARRG